VSEIFKFEQIMKTDF